MTAMLWFRPSRPIVFRHPRRHRADGRSARGALRSNSGATAIEFAMLFPVYLLLLLGVVEFGRMFWTQSTLQQAVEAAARCASVNPSTCGSASATADYAAAQMYGVNIPSSDFTVTSPAPACGNQVTASVPFSFIVSALFPWNVTLTAQSCFPLQS
jgi:Flp pilus assembly protein TadG